jgi:hypothetical protein
MPPRVMEVGNQHFYTTLHPERATFVYTGLKRSNPSVPHSPITIRALPGLWRMLRSGEPDLIIVYVEQWAPWHWKHLRRIVSLHPLRAILRLAFVQSLRLLKPGSPLIVVDITEWGLIHRYNEFLLDKCKLYFKRELPVDRWRVFRRSSGGGHPGDRFRRNARNRRRIETLRPLSLGCTANAADGAPFPSKDTDLFVALTVANSSTLRVEGMVQIAMLQALGIKVDHAAVRLNPDEFTQRMSRAWLTWSPHGFGWDCFRHYEAPLALSVPVITAPTILRQFPLIDGEHCFYYFPDEPDHLARTVLQAIKDRDRLRRMAEAARSLVIRHHLWPGRIDSIVAMALGREPAPGGIVLDKAP